VPRQEVSKIDVLTKFGHIDSLDDPMIAATVHFYEFWPFSVNIARGTTYDEQGQARRTGPRERPSAPGPAPCQRGTQPSRAHRDVAASPGCAAAPAHNVQAPVDGRILRATGAASVSAPAGARPWNRIAR
jgi:hypothetical protein